MWNNRLKTGLLLIVISCAMMIGMRIQREQSYFEVSANNVIERCHYGQHFWTGEVRENIDREYVQRIVWDAYSIKDYPKSLTSRLFYSEKDNQKLSDLMMKKYDYYYERETECYIRGEKAYNKSDYWGDKAKRLTANFRVYESEFINLTFLNSVFIDYVITTKRIGSYSSTYASLVPMLNSMSRFLKEREKKELQYIKEIMPDFEMHEWQIALSDWKLANKVRRITPFQAKRFLRAMKFVQ